MKKYRCTGGGIGPLFRPFEMTGRFYDDIVRPVGRVWFANDACDRRARRWVEGAIESAVKNAFAIHTGMRNEVPVAAAVTVAVRGRSLTSAISPKKLPGPSAFRRLPFRLTSTVPSTRTKNSRPRVPSPISTVPSA